MWTGNLHRQPLSPLHRLSIYVEKTQSYSKKVEMGTAIHVERNYIAGALYHITTEQRKIQLQL